MQHLPTVLSIAGTDPTAGAGSQADLKAISATGGYAAVVLTALVAQNTQGVRAIEPISTDFIEKQLDAVCDDLTVDAVKIGMLHEPSVIAVVRQMLIKRRLPNIVIDPVMVAKDGSLLITETGIAALSTLFEIATLITPNRMEAECLLGKPISSDSITLSAETLGRQFQTSVLLKGGHFEGETLVDVLYHHPEKTCYTFHADRIATKNTHGTGCTLSAAIASYLAQGHTLHDAVDKAKVYMMGAIASGARYQIGKGQGPVDHFFMLR